MKEPEPAVDAIPFVTTEQMVEVDRAMIEDYRIELIQMMENAGRNLAHLARVRFLGGDPRGRRVVLLAGPGGNGGGALVCARRLANWGANVIVATSAPLESFTPVPGHQLDIVRRMGIPVLVDDTPPSVAAADLIIDGIVGYSLQGAPHGTAAQLIEWANSHPAPVLSLDAPSGVDTTSGQILSPAIRATATMTLALPKRGLRAPGVAEQVGELYLADISVPPALYREPALHLPVGSIFARDEVLRLG